MGTVNKRLDEQTTMSKSVSFTSRFTRVTSSGTLIPEIDGLRFIAIASVVLLHASSQVFSKEHLIRSEVRPPFSVFFVGYYGVWLFFAISGFVLALPFAQCQLNNGRPVSLRHYFVRRVVRIEPPYFVSIILTFLVLAATQHIAIHRALDHLALHLLYLNNGAVILRHPFYVSPVAWSLEIEIQFYVLAPLLCRIFRIRGKVLRRGILLAAVALLTLIFQFFFADSVLWRMSILGNLNYFLVGLLLADIYVATWNEHCERSFKWDLISAVTCGFILFCLVSSPPNDPAKFSIFVPGSVNGNWSIPLPFAVLILYIGAFRSRYFRSFLRIPWIVVVGGMCYTIYLYHFQVIIAVSRASLKLYRADLPIGLNLVIQLTLMLPAVAIICGVLFLAVERPFMKRGLQQEVLRLVGFADRGLETTSGHSPCSSVGSRS